MPIHRTFKTIAHTQSSFEYHCPTLPLKYTQLQPRSLLANILICKFQNKISQCEEADNQQELWKSFNKKSILRIWPVLTLKALGLRTIKWAYLFKKVSSSTLMGLFWYKTLIKTKSSSTAPDCVNRQILMQNLKCLKIHKPCVSTWPWDFHLRDDKCFEGKGKLGKIGKTNPRDLGAWQPESEFEIKESFSGKLGAGLIHLHLSILFFWECVSSLSPGKTPFISPELWMIPFLGWMMHWNILFGLPCLLLLPPQSLKVTYSDAFNHPGITVSPPHSWHTQGEVVLITDSLSQSGKGSRLWGQFKRRLTDHCSLFCPLLHQSTDLPASAHTCFLPAFVPVG